MALTVRLPAGAQPPTGSAFEFPAADESGRRVICSAAPAPGPADDDRRVPRLLGAAAAARTWVVTERGEQAQDFLEGKLALPANRRAGTRLEVATRTAAVAAEVAAAAAQQAGRRAGSDMTAHPLVQACLDATRRGGRA